ncbi:hypothetical protein BYT27DRAFT_7181092 [Phlegmacium glaucopus]|nr:hypothetical protein BYT27DRAFT_7181092 [Phlegmacium glaucopus]
MTFPKALPNLLVVLHPICVVDVSGLDDSSTLEGTFLATLWEHGYGRQIVSEKGDEIILSLQPFREDWHYSHYLVIGESAFSLSTQQNTDSGQCSPLFKLCAESSASGTFQMFVRIFNAPRTQSAHFSAESLFWEQPVPASKLPAITIVSRNDQSFLCHVHLKDLDVQTIGSVLNHIVQELQVIQYYFHPGRPTDLASAHKSAPAWDAEKNLDFVKYFKKDIDSNGKLTLSANVYKAKPALKLPMAVPSSDVYDIASIVGQKKPTHMIVKVYARRESDFACMVDLTGIEDPPAIRQRITHALTEHNYLIRGQLLLTDKDVSTATCHKPLTDEQLFVLCFCGGDSKDILGIFAEVSKVIFAHENRGQYDMKTISNISVKITDWESGAEYGHVSFDGQSNSYDCYHHLTYKVHEYIKEESKIIAFGPGPDFLFSLDARLLSKVLHLKGHKKGTLAISIILDSDEKDSNYMRLECCRHCSGEDKPPVPRKGRLRRWVDKLM